LHTFADFCIPAGRRRLLHRDFYARLGELARTDPARLGAVLGLLEGVLDDVEAVDAAVRLLEWGGSPGGGRGGVMD